MPTLRFVEKAYLYAQLDVVVVSLRSIFVPMFKCEYRFVPMRNGLIKAFNSATNTINIPPYNFGATIQYHREINNAAAVPSYSFN